jgi:Tol biopolymer transport system component
MRRSVAYLVVVAMVVWGGVTSGSEARPLRSFEPSRRASVPGPMEVIYSNFGPGMAFDSNPVHGWGTYMGNDGSRQAISQQFTPAGDYTFRTAQVAVSLYVGPASLHGFLQADSHGLPGAVIEEILIGGFGSTPAVVTATSALSPTLYKDTPYWLTLVAVGNAVSVGWIWNSVGDASSTTLAFTQGGSAAGPWSLGVLATRSAFQINGTPATPEPQPTSTPPTPGPQPAIYLPLIMGPPYYRIAFVSQRDGNEEIYVMNADGANPTNLSNNPARDVAPAWSTDGRKIAFERDRNIYVMDADGSNQTNLSNNPSLDYSPAWSPDGRRIAFERLGDIYVMNADGSNQTFLHGGTDPDWSPDGWWLAFVHGEDFYHYGWDIWVKKTTGITHAGDLTKALSADDQFTPAWSPDGRWIAFESTGAGYYLIYVVHPDGSNLARLATGHGPPAWSPDGRRIAFEQSGDIYVMNADGSSQTNLTTNPADDTNPVWSPDGRRIAFVSQRDGTEEIYVMNADGSNQTRLTTNPADDTNPVWSPTIN